MATPLANLAAEYHENLPGIVRATLADHGISGDVVDARMLGWDGEHVTVPVSSRAGRFAFLERWDPLLMGLPADVLPMVELYPWQALENRPERLFVAEGIHEALILESAGFPSVAATGSGLFFKTREWAEILRGIPEVVLAYRSGPGATPRRHLLGRAEVVAQASAALPHSRILEWPAEVGPEGGAASFFVTLRRSAADLEELLASG